MSDLLQTLKNVKVTLDGVSKFLAGVQPASNAAPELVWISHWQRKLKLASRLDNIIVDIERRSAAFASLDGFLSSLPPMQVVVAPSDNADYCGMWVAPEQARHFLVTNYLVMCWTVYDSVYDLFTRLAGSGKTTENDKPGKNRKFSEVFKNEGDRVCIHCGMDALIDPQYTWLFWVSYTFRNAFAHEGGRLNGEDILQNDRAGEYFKISSATKTHLLSKEQEFQRYKSYLYVPGARSGAQSNGPSGFAPSTAKPIFPWYDEDIRTICKKYNAELDNFFARTMVWAANSLKDQVEAFLGPVNSVPNALVV